MRVPARKRALAVGWLVSAARASAVAVDPIACAVPTRTLRTDCAERCPRKSVDFSCLAIATNSTDAIGACSDLGTLGKCPSRDYTCQSFCFAASRRDATEYAFLIPFGEWQSEQEKQFRKNASVWWQAQIDALPTKSDDIPYLSNDYVAEIGPLKLPSSFRRVTLAGGFESDGGVKGKAADVSLGNDVFVNATSITTVTLANLKVGGSFISALPANVTTLGIINCLLEAVPSNITQLSSLATLNMSLNFLTSMPSDFSSSTLVSLDLSKNNLTSFHPSSLPSLQTLDLTDNFFTAIPTGVYMLHNLRSLRIGRNPLQLAALTPQQFDFLSQLASLEIDGFSDTIDCSSGERRILPQSSIAVCVTSAENIETQQQGPGAHHKTAIIVGVTVGTAATILLGWFLWTRHDNRRAPQRSKTEDVAGYVKLDSEQSNASGGDIVDSSGDNNYPRVFFAKPTPDDSTSATQSHASSLLDQSNSSGGPGVDLSNGTSSSGENSATSSLTQTRTIVLSRSQSNLSGSTLWDDGELNAYLLKYEDIEDVRLIGSGAHGVVWLVNYRKTRQLASKRLVRDQITRQKTFDFVQEIKLVAQLNHPSVVTFVGVAWTVETDLQALFEYMCNGDLRTYLEHTRPDSEAGLETTVSAQDEGDRVALSWIHDKWQIALSVCEALVYVHSFLPSLVHRDLKSRNVLLSHEMKAKLSDFGVARFESENGTMSTNVGTGKWLAPEVISGSRTYDSSCDVYAFGVVLSELDTHRLPYEDVVGDHGGRLPEVAILQRVAANQLKPTFLPSCPREIASLAMRCLSFDPEQRPSAVNIAFELRTFAKKHGFYVVEQL